MHFCNKCENMLYIRLLAEDSDSLVYYCRNCGETDETITKENICVLQTDIVLKEKAYLHEINEYTKLDPTLPRTNNIKCPNTACASNESADETKDGDDQKEADILYLRYDDTNMKFVYLCTECNTVWKSADDK